MEVADGALRNRREGKRVMIARAAALSLLVTGLLCLAVAPAAQAAGPYQLALDQGDAFAILGHSCGGIQEESFADGFAPSGYPQGYVELSTRCGGSGRGGGYKTTTYRGAATVVWTWFGETRSFARLEGAGVALGEATDSHGDRLYQSGTHAYLETGEPPLQPPAAPTGVQVAVALHEAGSSEYLQMEVTWTLDPATAGLTGSSTVTARPLTAGPPVLTATASGAWTTAALGPVSPNMTYLVTVTATDAEGTSEASVPVEVTSPNEDGEKGGGGGKGETPEVCEAMQGTLKLSPGLTETPQVQSITVKGTLSGCDGPAPVEAGKFVAHLTSEAALSCSALQNGFEQSYSPGSLVVKWTPKEAGSSGGALIVPVEEGATEAAGLIEGGPFPSAALLTGTVFESWKSGASCGLTEGSKAAKPVKSGSFSGSGIAIG